MRDVVIVDAVRTPLGKSFRGGLRQVRPDDMAAACIDTLLNRQPLVPPERIEDCIIGCAFPEGPQGMNMGRNVVALSSLPVSAAGMTVNRYCASGLQAIAIGAAHIAGGAADALVAGGSESISMTMRSINMHALFNPAMMQKAPEMYLEMDKENLQEVYLKKASRNVARTAENVAQRYGISRTRQDIYACESHRRAARAWEEGRFDDEIMPVFTETNGGRVERTARTGVIRRDECIRSDTDMERLCRLKPLFGEEGTVTAGNSSTLSDGAAMTLMLAEEVAERWGLSPLGRFLGFVVSGCEPGEMGIGPAIAIPKLLRKFDLTVADIDLIELNEAFASQVLYCQERLDIDPERLNIHGGAIAVGHPYGMTGARQCGHILRTLRERGERYGIVSMCVGGGMGAAALLEAFPVA